MAVIRQSILRHCVYSDTHADLQCIHVPVIESIDCRAGEHNALRGLPTSQQLPPQV